MIKTVIRLAIMLFLANAIWRLGVAYTSFYKFRDAVAATAVASSGNTDDQLKDKVMELAGSYQEPIAADAVAIRRDEHHTYIEGAYTKPITLLPGYEYPWPFSLNVDGFVLVPVKLGDLANP
jgi:hypothetical protein